MVTYRLPTFFFFPMTFIVYEFNQFYRRKKKIWETHPKVKKEN